MSLWQSRRETPNEECLCSVCSSDLPTLVCSNNNLCFLVLLWLLSYLCCRCDKEIKRQWGEVMFCYCPLVRSSHLRKWKRPHLCVQTGSIFCDSTFNVRNRNRVVDTRRVSLWRPSMRRRLSQATIRSENDECVLSSKLVDLQVILNNL